MNNVAAAAVAFSLIIPLTGCHPGVIICLMGQWGANLCAPPNPLKDGPKPIELPKSYWWVDKEGGLHATTGQGHTIVPGEYLIFLWGNVDVSAITDVFGQFGIRTIKGVSNDPARKNAFLVTLTEDPGPRRMEKLRQENAKLFQQVGPNYVYRPK